MKLVRNWFRICFGTGFETGFEIGFEIGFETDFETGFKYVLNWFMKLVFDWVVKTCKCHP